MTTHPARQLVALALAVMAALGLAAPGAVVAADGTARRSTVTIHDERGDARSRQLDVVQARFTNGLRRVEVAVRLADVRVGARTQVGVRMESLRRHEVYDLATSHGRGRAAAVELVGDTGAYLDCDIRSTWRERRDVIRLSFPRDCLGAPAALRVIVSTAWIADEMGDASDLTEEVRVVQGRPGS